MSAFAIALLACLMLLAGCATHQTAAPARRATSTHNGNYNDSPYGMNAFHPNGQAPQGHLIHFTDANMTRLKEGDIRWVRLMLDWRYCEPEHGKYYWDALDRVVDLCNKQGIGITTCLYEPPAWATVTGSSWVVKPEYIESFGQAIATRYKDRIAAYELDNEKASGTWPQVHERRTSIYVPMLKACYTGIKRGDPKAIVLMTGIWQFPMYYLEDMYKDGAKGYFDAINIHYYLGSDRDPKFKDPFRGDLDLVLKQFDYVSKKYGDGGKPIWFTEYGWPATAESQSAPVGEEKMAEYMKYFLEHCRDSGVVERCVWYVYYLSDGMALWHESQNKKRPAWFTHTEFQKQFPTWKDLPVKGVTAPPPAASKPATIANADFEADGGWTPQPTDAKFSFKTGNAQNGQRYLNVAWQKPTTNLVGQPFPIEGGKAYELTGWVRMTGGAANSFYAHAMVEIELLGDNNQSLNIRGPLQGRAGELSTNYYVNETDNKWYQIHYAVFAPDTAKAARIILRLGHRDTTEGQADFDNIRLEPLDLTKFDK